MGSVGRSCKGLCPGECVQRNVQCGGPGYSGPTTCCESTDTCTPVPGQQYSSCQGPSLQSPTVASPPPTSPPAASPLVQSPPAQSPSSCDVPQSLLNKCPYPESIIVSRVFVLKKKERHSLCLHTPSFTDSNEMQICSQCGTPGNDILIGSENNDCIFVLAGNDTLIGLGTL